jgi:hypothetical protein
MNTPSETMEYAQYQSAEEQEPEDVSQDDAGQNTWE